MANYHTINGKRYLQKDLMACVMAMRDRYSDGDVISGDEESLIAAVFERHPEYEIKAGPGIAYFTVGTNYSGKPTRCFYVARTDGLIVDFSVKTCISGAPTFDQELRAALRHAIRYQIEMFRLERWRRDDQQYRCERSGTVLSIDDVHIHHVLPNDFLSLVKQWLTHRHINGLVMPCTADLSDKALVEGQAALVNDEMRTDWEVFHFQHAKLELMDRRIHLRLKRIAA